MRSITIRYVYAGDEAAWKSAIDDFIGAIDADPAVKGRFTYQVAVADDGVTRIHWGSWDSPATLEAVQSQDYFQAFTAAIQDFAGDTLTTVGADVLGRTSTD